MIHQQHSQHSQQTQTNTESRERVLSVAERLFTERGYQAVTLRDIAQEVGIRHASLYYHFPNGKEEMYVAVTERRMQHYRMGLEGVIREAGSDWREQLRAAANWMLAQPTMYLGRMMQSEMRSISEAEAEQLRVIVFASLLLPLEAVFRTALANNTDERKRQRGATLAGMFLSLIEGIDNLPPAYVAGSKHELVDVVLDVMVNGIQS